MSNNPKDIAGRAKPQMHLIPHAALECVARVMELGAKKYGPYNWRHEPVAYTSYLSANDRHGGRFLDGEDQDLESGQSHLAAMAANALILLDAIITGNAVDDRPPKNPAYATVDPPKPVLRDGTTAHDIPVWAADDERWHKWWNEKLAKGFRELTHGPVPHG